MIRLTLSWTGPSRKTVLALIQYTYEEQFVSPCPVLSTFSKMSRLFTLNFVIKRNHYNILHWLQTLNKEARAVSNQSYAIYVLMKEKVHINLRIRNTDPLAKAGIGFNVLLVLFIFCKLYLHICFVNLIFVFPSSQVCSRSLS